MGSLKKIPRRILPVFETSEALHGTDIDMGADFQNAEVITANSSPLVPTGNAAGVECSAFQHFSFMAFALVTITNYSQLVWVYSVTQDQWERLRYANGFLVEWRNAGTKPLAIRIEGLLKGWDRIALQTDDFAGTSTPQFGRRLKLF